MRRILVTGGTGLVGKALETIVLKEPNHDEEWFFVGSSDGDLTNVEATRLMFSKIQPTDVIHLAAMVGGLFHNLNNNLEFLRKNMAINDNVLQIAHESNCRKVISCLSTCIFPDRTTYPIDETMLHNGPPHSSNYGYSYAKRLIDIQNHAYNDKYGVLFTSIIPCNIFGPHDNYHPDTSHVIPGMINRMYKLMHENLDVPEEDKIFLVYGSGKPMRQFIFSIDLARLIIWVLHSYDSVEPIILSTDEDQEISIFEIAQLIAKSFNFKGRLVCDDSKADGQLRKTACNKKLRALLPDFVFSNLEESIQKSVKWYVDNYNDARN